MTTEEDFVVLRAEDAALRAQVSELPVLRGSWRPSRADTDLAAP